MDKAGVDTKPKKSRKRTYGLNLAVAIYTFRDILLETSNQLAKRAKRDSFKDRGYDVMLRLNEYDRLKKGEGNK